MYGVDEELDRALARAEEARSKIPLAPLYDALAATSGVVGQRLARELRNELRGARLERPVTCVLTHVLVGPLEPSEASTDRPVGPVYSAAGAREVARTLGWRVVEQASEVWRRVVPRPDPLDIFGLDSIATLVSSGHVVVTAGGGGVPARMDRRGSIAPSEALLSPARTASLLATHLDADVIAVLDEEGGIVLDAGGTTQHLLSAASATELAALVREGRVALAQRDTAMAVSDFVAEGGPVALVAAGERLPAALAGRVGTRVTRAGDPSTARRQIPLPLDEDGASD